MLYVRIYCSSALINRVPISSILTSLFICSPFVPSGIPQQHSPACKGFQRIPPLCHRQDSETYQGRGYLPCQHRAWAEEREWEDWEGENAPPHGEVSHRVDGMLYTWVMSTVFSLPGSMSWLVLDDLSAARKTSLFLSSLSCYLGWRWGRVPQADWPEEGQAPGLPASTDRRVRSKPDGTGTSTQGCAGCQGEKKEKEKEGEFRRMQRRMAQAGHEPEQAMSLEISEFFPWSCLISFLFLPSQLRPLLSKLSLTLILNGWTKIR